MGSMITTSNGGPVFAVNIPKNNYEAGEAEPTVNDDETKGYSKGSVWINSHVFICVSAAEGAADWHKVCHA